MPRKLRKKRGRIRIRKRIKRVPRFISNDKRTFNVIIEAFQVMNTQAGAGLTNISASFPINSPTYALLFGPAWTQLTTTMSQDWARLITVFDTYRVKKIEVTFIPTSQFAQFNTVQDQQQIIYIIPDRDDVALITTEINAQGMGYKPFSTALGVPHKRIMYNASPRTWYNVQNYNATPVAAPNVTTTTQTGPLFYQSMKVFMPNVANVAGTGYYYGRCYVRWFVEFKSLRTA